MVELTKERNSKCQELHRRMNAHLLLLFQIYGSNVFIQYRSPCHKAQGGRIAYENDINPRT